MYCNKCPSICSFEPNDTKELSTNNIDGSNSKGEDNSDNFLLQPTSDEIAVGK